MKIDVFRVATYAHCWLVATGRYLVNPYCRRQVGRQEGSVGPGIEQGIKRTPRLSFGSDEKDGDEGSRYERLSRVRRAEEKLLIAEFHVGERARE